MNPGNKAIVIGAGVAGLASAIRLAVQGMEVTVYEKNRYPGGKLSHFTIGDYQFDAGPSLFTQPQNIEELFALAGEPIADYFSYHKMPVSCHYFYEDGTMVKAYADRDLFDRELVEKLGEAPGALAAYLNRSERIYRDIGSVFLQYSLHKTATLFKAGILRALKATRWPYLFRTMHQLNSR